MTKTDIWYPFYPSDYLRDTRHLTCLEHGAYRQILDAVFCAGGSFSVTDADLPRMLSISDEDFSKISKRIRAFFQIKDGVDGEPSIWKHKRISEEIRKANENKRLWHNRTEAARLSLQIKRGTVTKTVTDTVTDTVTSSSSPSPSPSPSDKTNTEEVFEKFWEAYPKHDGRKPALKAFGKVKAPIETLLAAIEIQKRSPQWAKDSGQFIPMAATWLNQERWNDSQKPVASGPPVDWRKNLDIGSTFG